MAAQKVTVRPIDEGSSRDYFAKAGEFYKAMKNSYGEGLWTAVGLNAVHCVISASDALLAKYGGIQNMSEDHRKAVDILNQTVPDPETKSQSGHLRKVLGLKNVVEYERRLFTQKEADEIMKQADRFYSWVKGKLSS